MDFWEVVVTTAIGSAAGGVVGGVVGAVIGWRALVRSDARAHKDREDDRRMRIEERFDVALGEIVAEIMNVGQAQADFVTWSPERRTIGTAPSPAHFFALIQSAMFTADPPERFVLDRMRRAFRLIQMLPNHDAVLEAVSDLSFAITQWRLGEATEQETYALFDRMIAEAKMLDAELEAKKVPVSVPGATGSGSVR